MNVNSLQKFNNSNAKKSLREQEILKSLENAIAYYQTKDLESILKKMEISPMNKSSKSQKANLQNGFLQEISDVNNEGIVITDENSKEIKVKLQEPEVIKMKSTKLISKMTKPTKLPTKLISKSSINSKKLKVSKIVKKKSTKKGRKILKKIFYPVTVTFGFIANIPVGTYKFLKNSINNSLPNSIAKTKTLTKKMSKDLSKSRGNILFYYRRHILMLAVSVIMITLVSYSTYAAYQFISSSNKDVVQKVDSLVVFPIQETPKVYIIQSDKSEIFNNPLFKGIAVGDNVLSYTQNGKVVIYRSKVDKIVNIVNTEQ